MANDLEFSSDLSGAIKDLQALTKGLDGVDVSLESIIDIVTKFSPTGSILAQTFETLTPAGDKVTYMFKQMSAEAQDLIGVSSAASSALELVTRSVKQVNSVEIDSKKTADLRALAAAAQENVIASSQGGSNNPNVQTNQFNNQLELLKTAALNSKAPLDDLLNLIGQAPSVLAAATGDLRGFANALFNLTQTANATKSSNLADLVSAKFSAGTPQGLDATQQAELTANTRAVGDAAAKAGLDEQGLNAILNQTSVELAKINGTYFSVAQAVIVYRTQLNKLTDQQVAQREEQERANAATASTAFAKTTFLGNGPIVGTNEEITKQTTALAAFQRAAEATGKSEQELIQITKDFTNGIVSEDVALANLNRSLVQIQTSTRASGATQRDAVVQDQKRAASLNQVVVAQEAIASIRLQFPIPSDASKDQVNAYSVALARLQAQIANTALTSEQIRTVFQSTLSGSGDVFAGEAGKIQGSVNSVVNSYQALTDGTKQVAIETTKTESAVTAFFSRVSSQVTTILINQLFHAFTQGVEDSRKFGLAILASAAIADDVGSSYDSLKAKVLELSATYGIGRSDVAEGLFQTLKHSIGDATQSAQFLAEAAQFAKVTNSSFTDSVNLGTAALNSFNLSASDAHETFAQLFVAIKSGRLSTAELSNTLGTVGVLGEQVGISLKETTSALSTLTEAGVNNARATTFLQNLFKELVTPTKAMSALLNEYGFSTGKAAAETIGLDGVLRLIQGAANGNIRVTGELITNLRGLQAALGLSGDKFDVFVKQLGKTQNAQDQYAKATNITFESNEQVFTAFKNQILLQSSAISDAVVSSVGFILKAFETSKTAIRDFQSLLISFTVASFVANLGAVVNVLELVATKVKTATLAVAANPLGLAAIAIGTVVFAIKAAMDEEVAAQEELDLAIAKNKESISSLQNSIVQVFKNAVDKQVQLVNVAAANINAAYTNIAASVLAAFTETSIKLRDLVDLDVKLSNEAINEIKNNIQKAETEISNLTRDTALGQLQIHDRIFEEQVKSLTLASQIDAREQRSQELVKAAIADNAAASAAASQGDITNALKLEQISKREFEEASKQLDKVAQATLKVTELNKGYTSTISEFIKKNFESEVKTIDESEKRVLESFKRVAEAVKDVHDKTGDASGDSIKFLRDFTKQLTSYLDTLKGATGRIRINIRGAASIDPDLKNVLDSLNPKTIKKLRYDIQVGNQEALKRILEDVKLVAQQKAAIQKAEAANHAEQIAFADAEAAKAANNFVDQRKFLKEAADFSIKSQADGFKNGKVVQAEQARLQALILQSFKDEATVRGVISNQTDETFKLTQSTNDVEKQQLEVMNQQVLAQNALKQTLQDQVAFLHDAKQEREDELVVVRETFQQLEKLKPNNGVVEEKDVENAKRLVNELKEGSISGFKFQDARVLNEALTQAAAKRDELEKLFQANKIKNEIESARVSLQKQADLRIETERKIREQIAELEGEKLNIPAQVLDAQKRIKEQETLLGNLHFAATRDPVTGNETGDDAVANAKLDAKLALEKQSLQTLQGQTNQINLQEDELNKLSRSLKKNKINETDVPFIDKILGKPGKGIQLLSDLNAQMDVLISKGQAFGLDITKPIELDFRTDKATSALSTFTKALDDLTQGQFELDFRKIQNNVQRHHFGGIVQGPNGIDAVPAMLTSGERVIDAGNSAKFFNQLNQISSGRTPTTSSSAVNFGGINITLASSGNAKTDARELAKEFVRLQSRGVIK